MRKLLHVIIEGHFGPTDGVVWWMDQQRALLWCREELESGRKTRARFDLGPSRNQVDCSLIVIKLLDKSVSRVSMGYVHTCTYSILSKADEAPFMAHLRRANPDIYPAGSHPGSKALEHLFQGVGSPDKDASTSRTNWSKWNFFDSSGEDSQSREGKDQDQTKSSKRSQKPKPAPQKKAPQRKRAKTRAGRPAMLRKADKSGSIELLKKAVSSAARRSKKSTRRRSKVSAPPRDRSAAARVETRPLYSVGPIAPKNPTGHPSRPSTKAPPPPAVAGIIGPGDPLSMLVTLTSVSMLRACLKLRSRRLEITLLPSAQLTAGVQLSVLLQLPDSTMLELSGRIAEANAEHLVVRVDHLWDAPLRTLRIYMD